MIYYEVVFETRKHFFHNVKEYLFPLLGLIFNLFTAMKNVIN